MAGQDGGMSARMDLQLRQKLVMTPQLQQAIKLLQLSRMEMNQEVQQLMLENPLVEDATTDTLDENASESPSPASEEDGGAEGESAESSEGMDLKWESYYDDEERERMESDVTWETPEERPSYEQTLARPTTLSEHLLWQLGLSPLSEEEAEMGRDLIGNINDDGYLETSLAEIAAAGGSKSESEFESALKVIQGFDPAGVGARNLTECLLIQIHMLNASDPLVETLIKNHLEDIEKRRYAYIAKACGAPIEEVMHASKIIERLEPKPGRPFFSNENFTIVPDVFIVKVDDHALGEEGTGHLLNGTGFDDEEEERYAVILNDDGLPKVRISRYYQSLLKSNALASDASRAYLEEKFRSAVWLIRSIEQRNRTTVKVAESILKFQHAFMKDGVSSLNPLVLRQVAEDIEMHESTVSRATTNKYMHTPQGLYEFKFFFNASVGGEHAESRSSTAVRDLIGRMVAEEALTCPLTDQKIVDQLKREGVDIARRTVSKYRFELKIAAASRRKRPNV